MSLKFRYDSMNEVPEAFRELYTERDGAAVLTGVEGLRTDEDVNRVQTALNAERKAHKDTKERLSAFAGLDAEDIQDQIAQLAVLKAKGEGKGDDDERVEKIITARVEAATSKLQRDLDKTKAKLTEYETENAQFRANETRGFILGEVAKAQTALNVRQEAREDVNLRAESIFEIIENPDGTKAVVTKSGVQGVKAGLAPEHWLEDSKATRPHWWPESKGGDARGTKVTGVTGVTNNPWAKGNWNRTQQAIIVKTLGPDRAKALAESVGSSLAAIEPPAA